MIETYFRLFRKADEDDKRDAVRLTGREIFVLCEFFARKGSDLWQWGSLKYRPGREEECLLSEDCLDLFGEPRHRSFLKTWLRIYLHEFFEPRESLPEIGEGFFLVWSDFRILLNFFLHHGGCLTNKFVYSE
jgi:hypothetical protein